MPCFVTSCDATSEATRVVGGIATMYLYHFLNDRLIIRPCTDFLVKTGRLPNKKWHQFRESMWKNVAVGTMFSLGMYIGWGEHWFMNNEAYFKNFPSPSPEIMKWYYVLYAAYWIQSIDFLLSITSNYYEIRRKDNLEMLVHHLATLFLMVFSYAMDLTECGICVLMIHDVNDLLLESAKMFNYLEWKKCADACFATFAVVWYIVRWGFYTKNIILGVWYNCYEDILAPILTRNGFLGFSIQFWYAYWVSFLVVFSLLLVLHIYWGYLIGCMVIKAIYAGNVEKDIRSDSDDENTAHAASSSSKPKKSKSKNV